MWVQNEIKGMGIKKMQNGAVEVGGHFENGVVNGKGFKKLKFLNKVYIYRGNLKDSVMSGYGVFKWPDGRHYIGNFVNA
jgi:hypothetical protein